MVVNSGLIVVDYNGNMMDIWWEYDGHMMGISSFTMGYDIHSDYVKITIEAMAIGK